MDRPIRVGLDPHVAPWAPEAKYALRTLLRIAGYPVHFLWVHGDDAGDVDLFYGPDYASCEAAVRITAQERPFRMTHEPVAFETEGELPLLRFERDEREIRREDEALHLRTDIVFATFWLLAGGAERRTRTDRMDNLILDDTPFATWPLLRVPLVSIWGAWLRDVLREQGREPRASPWLRAGTEGAVAFTHDVDYPQMIRSIESVRLLRAHGLAAAARVRGIWSGRETFWHFEGWTGFARAFGTRPAFYFMARRGSLSRYLAGTPDAFYDIRSPAFHRLFGWLRDEGCEVGLHASYSAFREPERFARERTSLEQASGQTVAGNRHHYWHLDPQDPGSTLRAHELAGLRYDSSLAFEFEPGFRRAICHPFRPFDIAERRELNVVQLPPAWMDDHFGRRRAVNGITDAEAVACALLDAVRNTGGIAVLDYHVRGWNESFFPDWGAWLRSFAARHLDARYQYLTPVEIADAYVAYERELDGASHDATEPAGATS
jgi:hypothetical protein